jgi:hypothetical protein
MDYHLQYAQSLADLLDNKFKILGFRFGLDPLIGLVPGIGDVIGLVLSAYIVWVAVQMKVPQDKIAMMLGNILFDFVIGLIPVLGEIGDFVVKANSKNLEILKRHRPIIIASD